MSLAASAGGMAATAGPPTPAGAAAEPLSCADAVLVTVRAAISGPQDLEAAVQRLHVALHGGADVAPSCVAMETATRWQLAAEAALRVDVERRLLAPGGAAPRIPLAGSTLTAVRDRCQAALPRIRAARAARRAAALDRHLPAGRSPLAALLTPAAGADPPPRWRTDREVEVGYWLDRLDPYAEGADVARVATDADRALRTDAAAGPQRLAARVRQVNARTAEARQPLLEAAGYLEVLRPFGPPHLTRALAGIVAGEHGLTASIRTTALSALDQLRRDAEAPSRGR